MKYVGGTIRITNQQSLFIDNSDTLFGNFQLLADINKY